MQKLSISIIVSKSKVKSINLMNDCSECACKTLQVRMPEHERNQSKVIPVNARWSSDAKTDLFFPSKSQR
jgi:glycine cleavage system regulatory protein